MSDLPIVGEPTGGAPEPPPPPPPPRAAFDFGKPFTFVFDDPEWLPKILMGGLFYLACFLFIGIPFVMGYLAVLVRNVVAGEPRPLPAWDDLGELFGEGLKQCVVGLAYLAPLIGFCIVWAISVGILDSVTRHDEPVALLSCFFVLLIPIFMLIYLTIPAALVMTAVSGRIEDGFAMSKIFSLIGKNLVNYILAILIYIIGQFISQFGILLLCIGVIFTGFWALLVSAHAFAQVYRLSEVK